MNSIVRSIVLSLLLSCLCYAATRDEDEQRLDTVLNEISMDEQYKFYWNAELDLVRMFVVKIDLPGDSVTFHYVPGKTLNSLDLPNNYNWNSFHWAKSDSCNEEVMGSDEIQCDLELEAARRLQVNTATTKKPFYLKPGDSILESNDPCAAEYTKLFQGHKVFNILNGKEVVRNDKMDGDVDVMLKNNVTVVGEMKKSQYCNYGAKVSDCFADLKQYFGSATYIVGDYKTNEPITADTTVEKDMIINVMKQYIVVLEYEGNDTAVDEEQIAESVAEMLGLNAGDVIVSLELDENNKLVKIYVYLPTYESANQLVQGIEKKDDCGIVCRSKKVYVKVGENLEEGYTLYNSIFMTVLAALVMLVLVY